ncbi:MAG: hypothetical protein WC197_09045 [Candidatus Gastranaerophilaceae bacterium]|jgi:hypothetical protein
MTIPGLVQNSQDIQFVSAFKKQVAAFSDAATQIIADKGSFLGQSNYPALFGNYMNITKICNNASTEGCWHAANETYALDGTIGGVPTNWDANKAFVWKGFILADGTLVATYDGWNSTCSLTGSACGFIAVDVYGFKRPNVIGKDIFLLWVYQDRLMPGGAPGINTGGYSDSDCTTYGWGCAYKVIIQ